jgi:hypothetical protein
MKTETKQCATTATTHELECVPCNIPPFCRNNYFTGKLLTERDFTAEQTYTIDKLRLHHLMLHGWGVVCGLKVTSHPHCPDLRIVVEPGMAVDSCGREIVVPKPEDVVLPKAELLPRPDTDPCPPEQTADDEDHRAGNKSDQGYYLDPDDKEEEASEQSGPGDRHHQGSPHQHSKPHNEKSPEEYRPEEPPDGHEPPPSGGSTYDLYVCLRYVECESEFMPAPFDECACTTNGQRPNRICEKYILEVMVEKPKSIDLIKQRNDKCEVEDCKELYDTMLDGCPEPFKLDCIPLAVIRDYRPGRPVTDAMIDNRTYRPLLPSTYLLDQLVRCILQKVPNRALTRIEDIGWTHGLTYSCHDFIRQFVGSAEAPRGFEVKFGGKLDPQGINRHTFQAVAVRHAEGGGGKPEVVPAKVTLSNSRKRAYLYIDPAYAHRWLHNARFDLYLILRCNLIVDELGRAVDGELMARLDDDGKYLAAPPTGDGTPGGLFESWIRVRP